MENRREHRTTVTLGARAIIRCFVFNQFGDCEGAMLRAGNVT